MVYPSILPFNAKAINFATVEAFSPINDIVFSVEYNIKGIAPGQEAGISIFFFEAPSLVGGASGVDLMYSGATAPSVYTGVSGAIIGVGIDTTGYFGVSAAIAGTEVRNGYPDSQVIPNSIGVRGSYTNGFPLLDYQALSATNTSFRLLNNDDLFRVIRVRLGNLGRTLYVDVKNSRCEDYTPLYNYQIADGTFDLFDYYRVGFGFTTPVNSSSSAAVATNVTIKTIHVEGTNKVPRLLEIDGLLWEEVDDFWENIEPNWEDLLQLL